MSPKPRDEDDKSKKYVERGIDSERAAEEKAADTKLTELAESHINAQAATGG